MSLDIRFGFGNTIKYNAPKLDVKSVTSTSTIISSRVRDIILDDTHDRFDEFGGWNSIGTIFIEPTLQPVFSDVIPLIPAYPAFPNIKQYPLINEIVPIIYLADPNVTENTSAVAAYYGSVRRITDQDTSIELGNYFNENNVLNNYPLLPYEGDIIYEGRYSNSIRLGSTVDNDKVYSNLWSSGADEEDFGSPIMILRNGQSNIGRNILDSTEPWVPTLENINTDKSSIYLTAGQQIPLVLSSDKSDSYASNTNNVPTVQYYPGDQILLNSGQLVFNSKDDNIVLSSNKSIHLSANTTLNFDAINQITLAAPKVYLGSSFGTEGIQLQSAVLGEELTQALLTFIQAVEAAAEAMTTNTAIIGPVATLTTAGPILKSACTNLKNTLNNKSILSNQVFVNKGSKR